MSGKTLSIAAAIILVAAAGAAAWYFLPLSNPLNETRIVDVAFDPGNATGFHIDTADVRCGADSIDSVQSRTYTNQGDIEFWCREKDQPLPVFKNIGKLIPTQSGSSIANISGRLYEVVSQSFYGHAKWKFWKRNSWKQWPGTHGPQIDGGRVINLQRRNGKDYRFVIDGVKCEGISVFSGDEYLGTYQNKDWSDWGAVYTDGKIVAINAGHRMHVGPLASPTNFDRCRALNLKTVGPPDWVYAITPIRGGLLYGGSSMPPYSGCAKLRFLDVKAFDVQSIDLPKCSNLLVSEYYSFAHWGKEILIGEYPYARLYAIHPDTRKVHLTDLVPVRPEDHWFKTLPYRESQSVLVADGVVMVGLYPWAELLVLDGKKIGVVRPLKYPKKAGPDFAPYETIMRQNLLHKTGASKLTDLTKEQLIDARNHALYIDSWSQRIPSVVAFSGRICLSTANFTGYPFDPRIHPIPIDVGRKYGDVFCADIPNHVLVSRQQGPVRLVLTDRYIGIEKDGVPIAMTAHHLSQKDLREIAAAVHRASVH